MELRIKKLELIMAGLLYFLPLILIWSSMEIRPSISDYAYSSVANVFVALLTLAGALFIYNGVINRPKWYNIILGISLIGVALTPHLDFPVLHYMFAALFFIGSMLVMVIVSSIKQRPIKIVMALIILSALLGYFIFNWFSLFFAEWIGIVPITAHFIGESIKKKY